MFSAAGADFRSLIEAAAKPGFRPIPLSASVTIVVSNQVRPFESQNILGTIDGSDDRLKNEYVVYRARASRTSVDRKVMASRSGRNTFATTTTRRPTW